MRSIRPIVRLSGFGGIDEILKEIGKVLPEEELFEVSSRILGKKTFSEKIRVVLEYVEEESMAQLLDGHLRSEMTP